MKKILAIALPIIIIIAGMVLLYLFVLKDVFDPPPDKVMAKTIEAARAFQANHTEATEDDFVGAFSDRTRVGLEREWRALLPDGSPRGSWYDMARGLLNDDGSQPEVVGVIPSGGEEGEGEEAEEEEDGAELEATVRIRRNREEYDIPFVREEGAWRINIPAHPEPWTGSAAPDG